MGGYYLSSTHYGPSAFLTSCQWIFPKGLVGRWVVLSTYTNEETGPEKAQVHAEIERLIIRRARRGTGGTFPSLNYTFVNPQSSEAK